MSKQLKIKPEKCTSCRTCEIICAYNRAGDFNLQYRAVSVVINDDVAVFVPVMCLQCEEGHCMKACAMDALSRDNLGTIKVDKDLCTGCTACAASCPYGGIRINPIDDKAVKCDLCGGNPSCVKYCKAEAILFEEGDENARKNTIELVQKAVKEASR